MNLRFAQSFRCGAFDPVPKRVHLISVKLATRELRGPSAEQKLIEGIFVITVRRRCVRTSCTARSQYTAPKSNLFGPVLRDLRQDGQPGPRIFSTLGVMRGGTQHRVRGSFGPLNISVMEGRNAYAELVGVAADLIQRQHPIVAVEGGILQALRHHWAAILLGPHGYSRDANAAEAA